LNNGGRVGLGKRCWNTLSENAWNILGKDFVTISPDGNGFVDVNADLIIADRGAIVPTTNFGVSEHQRLTFYSDDVKEIRVPAGGVLDLSAFGNFYRQELAFGGKVRLIFEPGSTLQFPDQSRGSMPVLYMNDNTELVFEGDHQEGKSRYSTITDADAKKIKIIGYGSIWLNKHAKIKIMRGAHVAVQSTSNTSLYISIRRQAGMYIGDETMAGGAFEVGNPTDGAGTITFGIFLDGPRAIFHIDREGYFGLGVGIINKSGNPNGDATASYDPNDLSTSTNPYIDPYGGILTWNPSSTAWQVKSLYGVYDVYISIDTDGGIIEHKNIFDGSDRRASLWAIGPISHQYYIEVADPRFARVRGGGNLMCLASGNTALVNIWDYADNYDRTDGTRYSIFASSPIFMQQTSDNFTNGTVARNLYKGQTFTGGTGDYLEFFQYLAYPIYSSAILKTKLICFASTEFQEYAGYINNSDNLYPSGKYSNFYGEIRRITDVNMAGLGDVELGLDMGVLGSPNANDADPFSVVGRR
jgi:hypothetical protein